MFSKNKSKREKVQKLRWIVKMASKNGMFSRQKMNELKNEEQMKIKKTNGVNRELFASPCVS